MSLTVQLHSSVRVRVTSTEQWIWHVLIPESFRRATKVNVSWFPYGIKIFVQGESASLCLCVFHSVSISLSASGVCVCVRACVRACVRVCACMCVCVRARARAPVRYTSIEQSLVWVWVYLSVHDKQF